MTQNRMPDIRRWGALSTALLVCLPLCLLHYLHPVRFGWQATQRPSASDPPLPLPTASLLLTSAPACRYPLPTSPGPAKARRHFTRHPISVPQPRDSGARGDWRHQSHAADKAQVRACLKATHRAAGERGGGSVCSGVWTPSKNDRYQWGVDANQFLKAPLQAVFINCGLTALSCETLHPMLHPSACDCAALCLNCSFALLAPRISRLLLLACSVSLLALLAPPPSPACLPRRCASLPLPHHLQL